jgi:hypothetical protein
MGLSPVQWGGGQVGRKVVCSVRQRALSYRYHPSLSLGHAQFRARTEPFSLRKPKVNGGSDQAWTGWGEHRGRGA